MNHELAQCRSCFLIKSERQDILGVLEEIKNSVSRLESEVQGCRAELSQVEKQKRNSKHIFCGQVTKSDLANRSRKNTSLWVSPTHLNVSRTVSNTSSPSISPRPTPRDFALNFSQVGMVGGGFGMVAMGMVVDMVRMRWVCYQKYCQVGLVAVGAVKMKRKILPAGSEDWPKDLIQEKLLEAVTCPNICLQVAIFYFVQN